MGWLAFCGVTKCVRKQFYRTKKSFFTHGLTVLWLCCFKAPLKAESCALDPFHASMWHPWNLYRCVENQNKENYPSDSEANWKIERCDFYQITVTNYNTNQSIFITALRKHGCICSQCTVPEQTSQSPCIYWLRSSWSLTSWFQAQLCHCPPCSILQASPHKALGFMLNYRWQNYCCFIRSVNKIIGLI